MLCSLPFLSLPPFHSHPSPLACTTPLALQLLKDPQRRKALLSLGESAADAESSDNAVSKPSKRAQRRCSSDSDGGGDGGGGPGSNWRRAIAAIEKTELAELGAEAAALAMIDADGSGVISFNEFLAWDKHVHGEELLRERTISRRQYRALMTKLSKARA